MSNADERLAAAPVSPGTIEPATLAPVRRHGKTLYASGQVAMRDGKLIATGLVGAEVDIPAARECAWQCARNVLDQVLAYAGSLDDVELTRLTVYVASAPGFTEQHVVAHGASALMVQVLGDAGAHARTAFGVAGLPLGSPVEVDAIFRLRRR